MTYKKIIISLITCIILPAQADLNDPSDLSNTDDQLSDFSPPPMEMMGDEPLPLESTGEYPAGMPSTQPLQPSPETSTGETPLQPLSVHLDLDFTNIMNDEVTLEYQYFYNDIRRMPWKGQVVFLNHNNDQSVQIPRTSAVSRILLFLRPVGAGSKECVPASGQSPVLFTEMTHIELKGMTDANGNHLCQLVYE